MFKSSFIPKNYQITGSPIIQFQAVKNTTIPKTDWIFFTSKNAVRYFFESGYQIGGRNVACIGEGTKRVLSNFCQIINFIGQSNNMIHVGQDFREVLNNKTCLFPISNISKRTIQKQLKGENQAIDLIVYRTAPKKNIQPLEDDILIFTSPSNAAAYLTDNSIAPHQKVIAIGRSTKEQLKSLSPTIVKTAPQVNELGMIDAMLSV